MGRSNLFGFPLFGSTFSGSLLGSARFGRAGGGASSGRPKASLSRRMAVSATSGAGSCLATGSPVASARFSSLRFARASFDFWIIQLIMLINAISRRMTSCSVVR
jgi:hypothetical protein